MSLPPPILRHRDRACAACHTPCALRDAHADPCVACPLERPAWTQWDCRRAPTDPVAPQPIPLGDRIHAVAQPIAEKIDKALGTDLANCGGCAAARRAFNGGGSLPGEKPPAVI